MKTSLLKKRHFVKGQDSGHNIFNIFPKLHSGVIKFV